MIFENVLVNCDNALKVFLTMRAFVVLGDDTVVLLLHVSPKVGGLGETEKGNFNMSIFNMNM